MKIVMISIAPIRFISGRISWNPTQNLALQFSHGYIKSPEALEPDLNGTAQPRRSFITCRLK